MIRRFPFISGILLLGLGVLVLTGWYSGIYILTSFLPGKPAMNPATAILFIFLGAAILCLYSCEAKNNLLSKSIAAFINAVAVFKLVEIFFESDPFIDQLLFTEKLNNGTNTISILTCFSFFFLSLSILFIDKKTKTDRAVYQPFAVIALFINLITLIGYLYSSPRFYTVHFLMPMSLPASIAFLIATAGILILKPFSGAVGIFLSRTNAGYLARRTFPFIIIVPLLTGWIRLFWFPFADPVVGIATLTIINIFLLTFLLWISAKQMYNADKAKGKIEDLLRNTNEWLETTLKSIGDGVIAADKEGNVQFMNKVGQHITGYATSEARGKKLNDILILVDEKGATLDSPLFRIYEGVTHSFSNTCYLIRKGGPSIPVEISASPMYDHRNNLSGVVLVIRDITKEKLNRDSLIYHSLLLKNSSEAIMSVDLEFRITSWNPAAEKLYGFKESEVKGLNLYDVVKTDFLGKYPEDAFKVLNEQGSWKGESIQTLKGGKRIPVMISSSVIVDNNNNRIGYLSINEDITERKELERKIIQMNNELDELVKKRTSQLQDTNERLSQLVEKHERTLDQLQEANAELELFLYKASHDLKGPLSSTTGLLTIAKKEVKDETADRYLKMIEKSLGKLNVNVNGLLLALTIKKSTIQVEHVEMRSFLDEILDRLKFIQDFERVTLHVNINVDEPIQTDRKLLESILQNLIENSIKYQDHSLLKKPELSIEVRKSVSSVILTVEDNGIGISDDQKASVFDMFFRANTIRPGSGLGLYLVKKGVEKLKGEINLESGQGVGTKITVTLPASY